MAKGKVSSGRGGWGTRASLLTAGLLLAFLLAEAGVRMLGLGPLPLLAFRPHPTRMFDLAPNLDVPFVDDGFRTRVRTNALGLRHPPLSPASRSGEPRIIALGDSFTFGYGVEGEQAWPARLEAELRRLGLPRAEVINAGVIAYAPDQELDLLRELLPRLRPDIVLVGIYVGNDVAEVGLHASAPPMSVSAEGALIENPRPADLHPDPVRGFLRRHSRLYAFARVRLHRLLVRAGLRPAPALYHRGYFRDALGYTDAYARDWALLESILADMRRASEAAGARLVITIIPMDVQVSDRYWAGYRALGFRFDPAILVEARPQDRLRAMADRNGILAIDLLPIAREDRGEPLYLPMNPHWNAAGHALAAREIAARISRFVGN